MAQESGEVALGWKAADFELEGVDGKHHRLADLRGPKGLVVMFICNHCPYVKAVVDRLVADLRVLKDEGIGAVAIMSNDTDAYPADSFDKMKEFAAAHDFGFPYVIDRTQAVARSYGAACTPEFFGFDAALQLRYHGRLDEGRTEPPPPGAKRELLEAMQRIAATGQGPLTQIPSIGCSIKWK